MGYFDSIGTQQDEDVLINNTIIKNTSYQSKDFMYDANEKWVGNIYEITKDGCIYFTDEELKDIKITGLANIYNNDLHYWLLINRNKIVKVYKNVSFEDLPKEVQKYYDISFGDEYILNINIKKLSN